MARYRPAGRSFLVFLAYPLFRAEVTELSPVEAWAQPFGFDQLAFSEDGSAMSYELHYQQPMSRLSLLTLSAFTRNAHGLLLDLEDPRRVLRRSDDWVFAPEMPYERQGDVSGVVFPCGWILDRRSGAIRIYYGGADSCLALATAQLGDVLGYLSTCSAPPAVSGPTGANT